jgi:hypothetical protein
MALTTASLPLIVVVIDQPRQPMPKARILGFLSYAMFLATFCVGAVSSALSSNSSGIAEILGILVFQSGWLLDSNNADRHEATKPQFMVIEPESAQSGGLLAID